MSIVKKIKDILFEEDDYTEPIKIRDDVKENKVKKEEDSKSVFIETEKPKEEPVVIKEEQQKPMREEIHQNYERDLFKTDNTFKFPDFDEEEFASLTKYKQNTNVLEAERKKNSEKRNEYSRYERVETKDVEKKKFKPSPIISPVYGILNQDYKAEDIVAKENSASNIDIDAVRKKAFEKKKEKEKEPIIENLEEEKENLEPVVTFFEEKEKDAVNNEKDNYKTIDDLLEEASTEIDLEDEIEIPKANNLDAIEEELEKIDQETKEKRKTLEDSIDEDDDSDVFEFIDSMYEEREEG